MQKILRMLTLQQQLNDATNGEGWEAGLTRHGKRIDWRRCSLLECAELIESYPWKHWKNIDANPDYDNIKIEAVDIWHFIMSQALQTYKNENRGDIETLASDMCRVENFTRFKQGETTAKDYYAQIETVEALMQALLCNVDIEEIWRCYFEVALQSRLDLNELYTLYIGKNILNRFRQDHGYKEGSYIKSWNGEEDNVIMQRLLEENTDITPEALYAQLQKFYETLTR